MSRMCRNHPKTPEYRALRCRPCHLEFRRSQRERFAAGEFRSKNTHTPWVVLVSDLRDVMLRYETELRLDSNNNQEGSFAGGTMRTESHWIGLLAERTGLYLPDRKWDSIRRTLLDVWKNEGRFVSADIADGMCLALNSTLELEGLKDYPGNPKAARERALIEAELEHGLENPSEEYLSARVTELLLERDAAVEGVIANQELAA